MKIAFIAFAVLVMLADAASAHSRVLAWRIWPQDCFLMPDVAVALDALGPYCSSPRGGRYHIIRSRG
jgi:hypothetical protein